MKTKVLEIIKNAKNYFILTDSKEDEAEVRTQVEGGVVFRGPQLWILMFAILIASLGLNVNSTAVIIGAMLISPLMGPIIGMGFSVGVYDFSLLKRSAKNYLVATLISVLTATVYFLISPLSEAQSELLARTSPTLYDVLIAFFGGAAGVMALTTKGKGQVIPGVAIATALMPPLCTAGYGLATAQWSYFLGAFYLFFINTVFIALSTFLGVKLLKFEKVHDVTPERERYARRVITWVVVLTMLPAAIMTVEIVRDNIFNHNVQNFVRTELQQRGTQILSTHVEHDTLQVVAVGRSISDDELVDAQRHMPSYRLKGMTLMVIQGTDSEGLETLAAQLNSRRTAAETANAQLTQQLADTERQLARYTRLDPLALQIAAESTPLFPNVADISIGEITNGEDPGLLALVKCRKPATAAEREKITQWLRTRVDDMSTRVVFTTAD